MRSCIKCGCPDNAADADFCKNCGTELIENYCTNDDCFRRNNSDRIPCDDDACYCDGCGHETEYFKRGLIKPKVYRSDNA